MQLDSYFRGMFGEADEAHNRGYIAGKAGFEKHIKNYKTKNLHRYLTRAVEYILGEDKETGDVTTYYDNEHNDRYKYIYYDYETEKYGRVKHIYSIGRVKKPLSVIYYEYQIPNYQHLKLFPKNYILTAFNEIDNNVLIPTHFWIINSEEKLRTQRTYQNFYERETFTVYETDNSMMKMKIYEDNEKLKRLKEILSNTDWEEIFHSIGFEKSVQKIIDETA